MQQSDVTTIEKIQTFTPDIALSAKLDMTAIVTDKPRSFSVQNNNVLLPTLLEIRGKNGPRLKDLGLLYNSEIKFSYVDSRTEKEVVLLQRRRDFYTLSLGMLNAWIKSALRKQFAGPYNSNHFKELFQSHYKNDPYVMRPKDCKLVIRNVYYYNNKICTFEFDKEGCHLTYCKEWI